MKMIEQAETVNLYLQLEQLAQRPVPVVTSDRFIQRKEQARLARDLFKKLGVKGISVTAPNYSMASTVDVTVPTLKTSDADFGTWKDAVWSDMPDDLPAKMKMRLHEEAKQHVEAILSRAFPNHDDRSDSQSDHFDSKWSF